MNDRFAKKYEIFFLMSLEVYNVSIYTFLIDPSKEMITQAMFPFPPYCQVAILS